MTVAPEPAGRGLALFAAIPDGERRDGGPELVIRGEHPVVAMPALTAITISSKAPTMSQNATCAAQNAASPTKGDSRDADRGHTEGGVRTATSVVPELAVTLEIGIMKHDPNGRAAVSVTRLSFALDYPKNHR